MAQVVVELADHMRPDALPQAAATAPIAWAQRLGYLLERAEAPAGTMELSALKEYVRTNARESTPLLPGEPHENSPRDADWKLWINVDLEPEL